jgi:hypothetical protein
MFCIDGIEESFGCGFQKRSEPLSIGHRDDRGKVFL